MEKLELLSKINELEKQMEEEARKRNYRKANTLNKQYKELVIEYNKSLNLYYHEAEWINVVFSAIQHSLSKDLTGNDLTRIIALELNKIDGVIVEECFDRKAKKLNYLISVVTPYTIYDYKLYRGYDGVCSFDRDCFEDTNCNKSRSEQHLVKEHICELMYASPYEELKTKCGRNILDKTEHLDTTQLTSDYLAYKEAKRREEREREEEEERRFNEENKELLKELGWI